MTTTIPTLKEQQALGLQATLILREAADMMNLIAEWDGLRYSEKLAESDKGSASRFFHVPGFELAWCGACVSDVLLDYSEYPEGQCMVCEATADGLSDRAAA